MGVSNYVSPGALFQNIYMWYLTRRNNINYPFHHSSSKVNFIYFVMQSSFYLFVILFIDITYKAWYCFYQTVVVVFLYIYIHCLCNVSLCLYCYTQKGLMSNKDYIDIMQCILQYYNIKWNTTNYIYLITNATHRRLWNNVALQRWNKHLCFRCYI